jgi:CTP synthase (UTP-ammonia lyase)
MEKVNEPALLEVWFVDFFNQESCVYASVGLSDFDAKLKTDNKVRMSLGSLTDSKVVGEVKQTNTHVTFQVYKTIDQKPKVAILRLPQQSQKMNLARKLADFKDVLLFKDFLKIDLPNMTP